MVDDKIETESIDRLFLELSQFTKAKTAREIKLEAMIRRIATSGSWEAQGKAAEIALAEIENRTPERWATEGA